MRRIRSANSRLMARLLWRAGRAAARAGLALGQAPVAADVALLGPHDKVHRVAVAHVAHLADGRRVDPRGEAGLHAVDLAVVELHLDRPAVDEVQLLLLLVEVAARLEALRQ